MNKKLIIHIFVLVLFLQNSTHAMNNNQAGPQVGSKDNALYALGLVAAGTTAWALIERYKSNKVQQAIKLLKSEKEEAKRDELLLKEITLYFENIDKEYMKNSLDLKEYLNFLKSKINPESTVFALKNSIKLDLDKIIKYKIDLSLKISQWSSNLNKVSYLNAANDLHNKADIYINFLNHTLSILEVHDKYIELEILVDNDYQIKYSQEIEIYNNKDLNSYSRSIDKHILYLYNNPNAQFPYIEYAQKLDKDRALVKRVIDKYINSQVLPFEKESLDKIMFLDRVLKYTLDLVVTSNNYLNEKKYKPEFDRQQERLRLEVKEKETKIELSIQASKAVLQKEENKAKELSNKEYELKKAKRDLEVKEKEIMYNWARIRDGETIRENDKIWQKKLDESKDKYNKSLQDYNNIKYELEKVKSDYKKQVNDLSTQVRQLSSNANTASISAFKQEIDQLNKAISNAKSYISSIEDSLNRPPFNPQSVDDLPEYLNALKNKAKQIKNSLN